MTCSTRVLFLAAAAALLMRATVGLVGVQTLGRQRPQQQHRPLTPRRAQERDLEEKTVRVRKPMGLILEEGDGGVCIARVDPSGNAAGKDLLINDVILSVEDERTATFEAVMDAIKRRDGEVRLTLGRRRDCVEVRWPHGVGVAATPGEDLRPLAELCGWPVQYSCSSGSCAVCEHRRRDHTGSERYTRVCVGRVPTFHKDSADVYPKTVDFLPTDR